MDISLRLRTICNMVAGEKIGADIGTDHAYIPIYLVKNGICEGFIASDINKGPVEKAKFNIGLEGLQDKIQCRLGGGLNAILPKEVDFAIIAGMGGNLIRDIIIEGQDVFKELQYAILQPVQNPEVLREFIYKNGYRIIDEDLCIDENKFYEIIKVKYDNIHYEKEIDPIFYEVSKILIDKKHPFMKQYVELKLTKYNKIFTSINENTVLANNRREELRVKIHKLKELIACL